LIKAIIFDFDGLILDTETHEFEVLNEIFGQHGTILPIEIWGKVIGTAASFRPFTYLEEQVNKKLDQQAFEEARKRLFEERISKELPRPGVESYLQAAKELGLKIGLASSSSYDWVSTHLQNLGLQEFFQCIKTSNDVEKVKPDPALYLEAAKCLGVEPQECLAFEDSVNGLMAAKRAGMYCVIVPNKVTQDLPFQDFDHRLNPMAEFELSMLIKQLIK
jgi:HAD superfamily hydrolase (TIGR01509 family)